MKQNPKYNHKFIKRNLSIQNAIQVGIGLLRDDVFSTPDPTIGCKMSELLNAYYSVFSTPDPTKAV